MSGILADGGDRHALRLLAGGDEVGHPVDPATPQRLVLVEQATRQAQRLDAGAHDLATAASLLGDEPGSLEHGDVLLHRRKAHGVVAGQLCDTLAAVQRPQDDVTPGRIGEGGEDLVGIEAALHRYNHTVV